jgi:diguanylate cyclase (GGDEF)-like protein
MNTALNRIWAQLRRKVGQIAGDNGDSRVESTSSIDPSAPEGFSPTLASPTGMHGFDALTGLALNDRFLDQVRFQIAAARRRGLMTAVIYIALNDIKRLNDGFGVRFGDILIRQAAFRLHAAVRQSDSLARVGGIHFAVVLEPFEELAEAINTAQRLLDIMGETFSLFEIAEHPVGISASVGISAYPGPAESAEELLNNASIASSEAARRGLNQIEVFSLQRQEESRARLEMEWMVRRALDKREFTILYQPEIDLLSNRVVRQEALLRLEQTDVGQISPATFIPLAEQTGLIVPLGDWVLREACKAAAEWQVEGEPGIGVGVNVSTLQLIRPDFTGTVEAALEEARLRGELLELEITESAIMANPKKSISDIRHLRDKGVSVVIDDFGVGYSSLSYLRELPVSGVKLDRSFLRDLRNNPNTLPFLHSIVSLAHCLKMRVTVEGVETPEELNAVKHLGVDAVQGFLLGRPRFAEKVDKQDRASSATC